MARNLDDDAVMERMHRIIPGHTVNHALHNIDVLAGMISEIRNCDDPDGATTA